MLENYRKYKRNLKKQELKTEIVKPSKHAWSFYVQKNFKLFMRLHPETKPREIAKIMGEKWKGLSNEEKLSYIKMKDEAN